MRLTVDATALDDLLDGVEGALDLGVRAGLARLGRMTADEARRDHPYADRTGRLTASTRSGLVRGTLRAGLAVDVTATADHASYVDGRPRFAFLEPAWRRVEPEAEAILSAALAEAVG